MHEYFQGTVGERIQDLLREKKMTQAVLAQRTQISKATLNRYITDENSRIPHDALLQIARVLGVSTDFLLGATDIPYRTNYDIEELGLTAAAAAKLYTGELNPHIVSQLLENPYFAQMVSEIAAFMEGTESAAAATYNGIMKVASKVMYLQGKKHPEDRAAAKAALWDMKNHMIPSMQPDMTMIRAAFENLLADLRRQSDEYVQLRASLTSSTMESIIRQLEKRQDGLDLKKITLEDIAGAITEQLVDTGMPDEKKEGLRKKLVEVLNDCAEPCRKQD